MGAAACATGAGGTALGGRKYLRFSVSHRIEHWVQMASFPFLGLPGLVQKYAANSLS